MFYLVQFLPLYSVLVRASILKYNHVTIQRLLQLSVALETEQLINVMPRRSTVLCSHFISPFSGPFLLLDSFSIEILSGPFSQILFPVSGYSFPPPNSHLSFMSQLIHFFPQKLSFPQLSLMLLLCVSGSTLHFSCQNLSSRRPFECSVNCFPLHHKVCEDGDYCLLDRHFILQVCLT